MKTLPTRYEWLDKIEVLPRTIKEARKLFGTLEIPGSANSPEIMSWVSELDEAGLKLNYTADSVPWCGLAVAIVVFRRAGDADEIVKDPLWARNWLNYGEKVAVASLGDVLVFRRKGGGGHVAFYVGEDSTHFHILGGNQLEAFNIARIEKDRLLGVRRPLYKNKPTSVKPYRLSAVGTISKNEA